MGHRTSQSPTHEPHVPFQGPEAPPLQSEAPLRPWTGTWDVVVNDGKGCRSEESTTSRRAWVSLSPSVTKLTLRISGVAGSERMEGMEGIVTSPPSTFWNRTGPVFASPQGTRSAFSASTARGMSCSLVARRRMIGGGGVKRSLSVASIPVWDKLLDGVQTRCRPRYEGTGLLWSVNVRDAGMPQAGAEDRG